MIFLLLSIACSTLIIVIFKLLSQYKVNGFYAIIVNYWVCVLVGWLTGAIHPADLWSFIERPWIPIALLLGILFIGGFYAINLTVRHNGITVASIVSKNAMVLSVTAAFFLYGDVVNLPKLVGIASAIVAIILTSYVAPVRDLSTTQHKDRNWLYPLIAFLVSGSIEISLKYTQQHLLASEEQPVFLIFLFGTAAAIGSLIYVVRVLVRSGKQAPQPTVLRHNLLGGILLGVPNYGSIYFLIKTLEQPNWESSVVYPINNIGVVLCATAVAWFFFAERLTKRKLLGVGLAIVAILLITVGTNG